MFSCCSSPIIITHPVSILHKSIAARDRPVRLADGPIMTLCSFVKNASLAAPFYSGIGGMVYVNSNGDKDADFSLLDLDPMTGKYRVSNRIYARYADHISLPYLS